MALTKSSLEAQGKYILLVLDGQGIEKLVSGSPEETQNIICSRATVVQRIIRHGVRASATESSLGTEILLETETSLGEILRFGNISGRMITFLEISLRIQEIPPLRRAVCLPLKIQPECMQLHVSDATLLRTYSLYWLCYIPTFHAGWSKSPSCATSSGPVRLYQRCSMPQWAKTPSSNTMGRATSRPWPY